MNEEPNPADVLAWQERQELFRIAAQRLLDHHKAGRKCDAEAVKWAQDIVARVKPLGRPLTNGESKHAAC